MALPAFLCMLMICVFQFTFHADSASIAEKFNEWMVEHGRTYINEAERNERYEIFYNNALLVEAVNANASSPYKLGLNKFADLRNNEIPKGHINIINNNDSKSSSSYAHVTEVPASLDWRTKGAVTAVKDQRRCGACWAFSAVAALEGINQIARGNLVSLSEQQLIDCDRKYDNDQGCAGGSPRYAFEYIMQNGGLTTESNYPYTGSNAGTCQLASSAAATITGFELIPPNNEWAMLQAVANQPVSAAVDSKGFIQLYSSGVFTGECGTDLDHDITIVGYGVSDDGINYWLAKSSWGENWGEEGYIRIQRDLADSRGLCGIAIKPSFPIIK